MIRKTARCIRILPHSRLKKQNTPTSDPRFALPLAFWVVLNYHWVLWLCDPYMPVAKSCLYNQTTNHSCYMYVHPCHPQSFRREHTYARVDRRVHCRYLLLSEPSAKLRRRAAQQLSRSHHAHTPTLTGALPVCLREREQPRAGGRTFNASRTCFPRRRRLPASCLPRQFFLGAEVGVQYALPPVFTPIHSLHPRRCYGNQK
jgi:hypothetical protein